MLLPHSVIGSQTNDPYFNNVSLLLSARDGVIKDYSKNNHAISVAGNTTISRAQAKWGNNSIYFNGNGDYLNIVGNDFIFNSDFSIEAFCFINSIPSYGGIFSCRSTSNATAGAAINILNTGKFDFSVVNTSGYNYNNQINVPIGIWFYVAMIRTGAVVDCYLNNNKVATFNSNADFSLYNNAVIGRYYINNNAYYLDGYIPALRITKGIARPISVPTQPFPNW